MVKLIDADALIEAIEKTPFTMSMFATVDQCYGAKCAKDVILDVVKSADAIEELQAQVPHWISVEERLPEDKEIVLAYISELCLIIRARRIGGDWFRTDRDLFTLSCYTVSHWMPLPAPPEEVDEDG